MDSSEKLKYYHCVVSKAGCTSWEHIAKRVYRTNERRPKRDGGLNLRVMPPRNLTFKRFINIRHPFDRLLSAFYNVKRNKKSFRRGPEKYSVKYLLQRYQTNNDKFSLQQFTKFLVSSRKGQPGQVYFDRHWDAYSRSCRTCSETYSFITRTETSVEDSGPILKLFEYPEDYLKVAKPKPRNHIERPTDKKNSSVPLIGKVPAFGKYLSEFEDLPATVIRKLYERYRADFEGFGYHFDMKTKMAYCSIKTEKGEYCC